MLSPGQLQIIHVLRKALGIEEDDYRDMLRSNFNVTSAKDLTFSQARDLIENLRKQEGGATPGAPAPKKYDNLEGRPGMASPAQLRKVEAMWKDVSVMVRPLERHEALERFLKNRFNCNGMLWLEASTVQKVIRSLQAMIRQDQKDRAADRMKEVKP